MPVAGDGCNTTACPAELAGNIAMVGRGTCPLGTKSELSGRAGAVIAVVYNTDSGAIGGWLGPPKPGHVATFSICGDDAEPVVKRLQGGERVDAIAYIDAVIAEISTENLIAQTRHGDPENCVMLCGHGDSVAERPGSNDDSPGSLMVLEVAKRPTHFDVAHCVRFAWWAGKEEGLLGSSYYVDMLPAEEICKIRLFMDYDMMASPNFAYEVCDGRSGENCDGSEELRNPVRGLAQRARPQFDLHHLERSLRLLRLH